ncbi:hypothetical protein ZHAS_00001149 [Anopheles sinensis]|uniref:Uncharacterized protein n=1 Tax=Anopheles sinensis TaxID=74873 RepID=A0A084VB31_ANOSI|nr:hypothetical protein ZHAS_00001149 [Anopheles sinensis]
MDRVWPHGRSWSSSWIVLSLAREKYLIEMNNSVRTIREASAIGEDFKYLPTFVHRAWLDTNDIFSAPTRLVRPKPHPKTLDKSEPFVWQRRHKPSRGKWNCFGCLGNLSGSLRNGHECDCDAVVKLHRSPGALIAAVVNRAALGLELEYASPEANLLLAV